MSPLCPCLLRIFSRGLQGHHCIGFLHLHAFHLPVGSHSPSDMLGTCKTRHLSPALLNGFPTPLPLCSGLLLTHDPEHTPNTSPPTLQTLRPSSVVLSTQTR